MPCGDFFERDEAKLCSPINMAPRPLSKPPVSFSLGDEVPHVFIRKSHQRPRKILISGGKRLFQQHRSKAASSLTAACQLPLAADIALSLVPQAHETQNRWKTSNDAMRPPNWGGLA